MGRLTNIGAGNHTGRFVWPVNPKSITGRSSACGSTVSQVAVR
jgi:hypothetical protein